MWIGAHNSCICAGLDGWFSYDLHVCVHILIRADIVDYVDVETAKGIYRLQGLPGEGHHQFGDPAGMDYAAVHYAAKYGRDYGIYRSFG